MLLLFRHAALKDAEACAEIYRPYVEKTSVTFEYTPPDKTEIARRMDCYTPTFPWIVAQAGEKVIGYAYGSPQISGRPINGMWIWLSIYTRRPEAGGSAVLLYGCLLELLTMQGYYPIRISIIPILAVKRCTVRWDLFLWLVGKKRGINWANGMMCNGSKSRLPPARHTPGRRFRLHSWMRDRCRSCLRGMRRRYRCEKAGQTMRGRMDSANKQIRPADHFDQKSGPAQKQSPLLDAPCFLLSMRREDSFEAFDINKWNDGCRQDCRLPGIGKRAGALCLFRWGLVLGNASVSSDGRDQTDGDGKH